MANDVSANPMVLDTPGSTVLWPANIKVAHFEFHGYASQASRAIIKGIDGKIKWSASGNADLSPVIAQRNGWIHGLVLDTLDDGKVLVYIE